MTSPGVAAMSSPTRKPCAEVLGSIARGAKHVLRQIAHAANEIGSRFADRPLDDHGIEPGQVRRRHDVEKLMCHETHACRVLGVHAADLAGGAAPPRFPGKEDLLPGTGKAFSPRLDRKSADPSRAMKTEVARRSRSRSGLQGVTAGRRR